MKALRLISLAVGLVMPTVRADDLPPPHRPIQSVIDDHVVSKLASVGLTPASPAGDAEYVRRVTLDLVGRIPTTVESDAFTRSTDSDKRGKLVDRLLASPGYARYQAILFEAMLSDRPGNAGKAGGIRDYLTAAMRDNRPWDRVFRDLMLPDESDLAKKGAGDFLKARLSDPDKLTVDASIVFFGVNVSCAQCHDHPHVKDWTQDLFYGMKGFFARSFDAAGFVAERDAGLVKFKPTKGPERQAKLAFLTGFEVKTDTLRELSKDELKREKEAVEKAKTSKTAPAAPAFSARSKLVEAALAPDNAGYFARAIVNRLWHRFLGYGLVNPLDQMHVENPPSHPELLDFLALDLITHGYDLRRLVRGIVLSQTYSRSSSYPSESHPAASAFAVARIRPLTPIQLASSLKIASTDPATFEGLTPDAFEKKIEQLEIAVRGFTGQLAKSEGPAIGVGEALLFSNGEKAMAEFLASGSGTLLRRVNEASTPADAVLLLVRTAHGRDANEKEVSTFSEYVSVREDRRADAYRQLLWALFTSPEFRFNH